jgi:hypothetical protein
MASDRKDPQLADLRNHAVEVITRTQDDAMRKLLQAGLPESVALTAMRRISAFSLQALQELDSLFRQFDDFVATEDRTSEQQEWLNDKAAALLLQTQTAFATLVAETIQKTIQEYRDQLAHPKNETPTVTIDQRPVPQQGRWELAELLPVLIVLGIVLGFIGWFLFWWLLSGSLAWGVIAFGLTVFLVVVFRMAGVVLAGIAGVLFLLLFRLF